MKFHLPTSISFKPIDPDDNGLHEEIFAERLEPEAIHLEEDLDEDKIDNYLSRIEDDISEDPQWFNFDKD